MKNQKLYIVLIISLFAPILFLYSIKLLQYFNFFGEILISIMPLFVMVTLIFQLIIFILLLSLFKQRWLFVLDFMLVIFCTLPLAAPIYIYYFPVQKDYVKSDNTQNVLTIFSANILYSNTEMSELSSTIKELSADIVFLNELTDNQYRELLAELEIVYPYSYPPDSPLNGFFSKLPPSIFEEVTFPNSESYLYLKVNKNGKNYDLFGVHAPAMFSNYHITARTEYMTAIATRVSLNPESKSLIIGDYNMSPWVWGYKHFLQELPVGFYNAGEKNGFYNSWSLTGNYSIPITLIDHALVSSTIKTEYFSTVMVKGSDHMGMYLEIK